MHLPIRIPNLVRSVFPGKVWSFPIGNKKEVYLTFDDGPIPELTTWILDLLDKYNAKATFFCVGENASKYPEILDDIIQRGHSIGNHTFNHLHGWKTSRKDYMRNVLKADFLLKTRLFRPPYGKLSWPQYYSLKGRYKIIMWSVLTQDYERTISPEQCLQRSLKSKVGDIVLFHDSIRAEKNLKFALPQFLEHFSRLGFEFKGIQ